MQTARNTRAKKRLYKREFLKNVLYNTLKYHIFLFCYFNKVFTKDCFEWKKYKCSNISQFINFPFLLQYGNSKPEVKQIFSWLKVIKEVIYEEKIYGLVFNISNKQLKMNELAGQLAISIQKTSSLTNLSPSNDTYFQSEYEFISCKTKTYLSLINHLKDATKKYKEDFSKKQYVHISEDRSISMKIFCKDTSSLLANKLFAKADVLNSVKKRNRNKKIQKKESQYGLSISTWHSLPSANNKTSLLRTKKLAHNCEKFSGTDFKLLSITEGKIDEQKVSRKHFSLYFAIENPENTKKLIESQIKTNLDNIKNAFSDIEDSESEHFTSDD